MRAMNHRMRTQDGIDSKQRGGAAVIVDYHIRNGTAPFTRHSEKAWSVLGFASF